MNSMCCFAGRPESNQQQVHKVKFFKDERETNNAIVTSKYRPWLFLPQNIWEQFHNLANVYFLVVMLLQCVPQISITSGKPTIMLPLSFVLFVAAVKDYWEDHKRKVADRNENEKKVKRIVEGGGEEDIRWHAVHAGNLLRVQRDGFVPADMLLVESSEADGTCSVETMNLDGETNLKQKASALPPGQYRTSKAQLHFEPPSSELYEFKGAMVEGDQPPAGVSINNLVLRGCSVRQTEWIIGLVVYCGHDTRIMRNMQAARFKHSELDITMNKIMILVFASLLVLCMFGGIVYAYWETTRAEHFWFLMLEDNQRVPVFQTFLEKAGTWLLQMNNMVPISLVVTITSVKFVQGKFISWDMLMSKTMKGVDNNEIRKFAEVHTSQVLESLGQLTHVFSDKTGTLTCNEMLYKCCSVAGKVYGLAELGTSPSIKEGAPSGGGDPHVDFSDSQMYLDDLSKGKEQELMMGFLLCHALCHNVTIDTSCGEGRPSAPDFQHPEENCAYLASSPDELALVSMARELGLGFRGAKAIDGKTHYILQVREPRLEEALGKVCSKYSQTQSSPGGKRGWLEIEILDICEFDNDRKRMSVVVRYPNQRIYMLLKGADTSVLKILPTGTTETIEDHLKRFARTGLRTLCLAQHELQEQDWQDWHSKYESALAAVSEDRAEQVSKLATELETRAGLKILGATAIEDRLQDLVPETIEHLRQAGIVVWVLTGDKIETAISIGKSCRLLTGLAIEVIDQTTPEEIKRAIESLFPAHDECKKPGGRVVPDTAITIPGATLAVILGSEELSKTFYKVAKDCKSILCCRVSPKQKADVVQLAKGLHEKMTGERPVTLAIGDGANDVAMINQAHVGVGLSGKEGAQAARVADFALSEFRFLQRLVFVHGRESNRKNSVLVGYNFYKNMLLVLPPYMYGAISAFCGQPIYDQLLYQAYNIFFTSLPIVVYALFDRPVVDLTDLENDPSSYCYGQQKKYFSLSVFLRWLLAAFLQAALLTGIALCVLSGRRGPDGIPPFGLWATGSVIFAWVVLGVNLTILTRCKAIFFLTIISIVGSVLFHGMMMYVLELAVQTPNLAGTFSLLYGYKCRQFVSASVLFVAVFLLVGEPILRCVEEPLESRSRGNYQELSNKSEQDDEGPRRASPPQRRIRSDGVGPDLECTLARDRDNQKGRRKSFDWYAETSPDSKMERAGLLEPV